MKRPTRRELLEYALEGVRTKLGTHPCPNEYPEEISEYEDHMDWLEKELAKLPL